jgi:hypothetical protein
VDARARSDRGRASSMDLGRAMGAGADARRARAGARSDRSVPGNGCFLSSRMQTRERDDDARDARTDGAMTRWCDVLCV